MFVRIAVQFARSWELSRTYYTLETPAKSIRNEEAFALAEIVSVGLALLGTLKGNTLGSSRGYRFVDHTIRR